MFKSDIGWFWGMFAVSFVMTVEYARLVLTTDVAAYRYFILLVWMVGAMFSLARLVSFYTRKSDNNQS